MECPCSAHARELKGDLAGGATYPPLIRRSRGRGATTAGRGGACFPLWHPGASRPEVNLPKRPDLRGFARCFSDGSYTLHADRFEGRQPPVPAGNDPWSLSLDRESYLPA